MQGKTVSTSQRLWTKVIQAARFVLMIVMWIQMKIAQANVADMYLGGDKYGLKGDTPGINHNPMKGGYFEQTWKEQFVDHELRPPAPMAINKLRLAESATETESKSDVMATEQMPQAAGSVDNCLPKYATPPVEWWRGWNIGYNNKGYKYLKSCRGPIKTRVKNGFPVKMTTYKKDAVLGWGFGNNYYPKVGGYIFPTSFTINNAYLFLNLHSVDPATKELYGAKSLPDFYIMLANKETLGESKSCFAGKTGNRWRYNGEREWNPASAIPIGTQPASPTNTLIPATTSTTKNSKVVHGADPGTVVVTKVADGRVQCKESQWFHDITGFRLWNAKFPDVSKRMNPTLKAKGGSFMQMLGFNAAGVREKLKANMDEPLGGNNHKTTGQGGTDGNSGVEAGGFDTQPTDPTGSNPSGPSVENPAICAPHAPFVFTANWGPATWNYDTIRLGSQAAKLKEGGSGIGKFLNTGANSRNNNEVEHSSKYVNFARNQNNNGILPGTTGYEPELEDTKYNMYVGSAELLRSEKNAQRRNDDISIFMGMNTPQRPSDNGSRDESVIVPALSFKFYTDDADPENREITPLTEESILKQKKYKYSYRDRMSGVRNPQLNGLVKVRVPTSEEKELLWGRLQAGKLGSRKSHGMMLAGKTKEERGVNADYMKIGHKDDAVVWNYARPGSKSGGWTADKLRLCVGGMLNMAADDIADSKTKLLRYSQETHPEYKNRRMPGHQQIAHGNRCMGLAVVDTRPTAAGRVPSVNQILGGSIPRHTHSTIVKYYGEKITHYRLKWPLQSLNIRKPTAKVLIDTQLVQVWKAIPNAPGYHGGAKAQACSKTLRSVGVKDCKYWLQPLEETLQFFGLSDMGFGMTIRSGAIACTTPYLTSISPHVREGSGKTILKGADLAFPFSVTLNFKFWTKTTWYVFVMVPIVLFIIEGILAIFKIVVSFGYNIVEFEMGFGVSYHDWGKASVDNEDNSWYFKMCFQDPVWGPLVSTPVCNVDATWSGPKRFASCPTTQQIKILEVNPNVGTGFGMKLMGVCSFCGYYDVEFFKDNGGLPTWDCIKVGTIAPSSADSDPAPTAEARPADGDCGSFTGDADTTLGKSVGRTGRARMAYAKQARCALAQDSCHDALESKDTSALTACLKDALSSRIQCDATARLDPYPSMGNLFAKEMDVFMGPNMGPDSATSFASIRAGYAQGLGSLRVERLSVQLTGSESDVKLRMNATVAPATAVQLRDVCWNWDDHMMKDVRHAKADKYTTAKQKGRFLVAAVQWHLKNGSGLDQKTRENMQDWVVMVKDMGAMGFLQKDPSVESREANTLSAHTSKMCSKLPLTGLRAELQMDVTSLGSGETAGQFSGSLRKFTVPLVEQAYHRTTQAQRAVESMLGGKRRFADVFGKIMREARNIMDKEAQHLMKATCTELRVLCPTCSDEAWECGL